MTAMEQMTDRIVREALAEARRRYADELVAARVHEVCDDAAEARRVALLRRRLLKEEWA